MGKTGLFLTVAVNSETVSGATTNYQQSQTCWAFTPYLKSTSTDSRRGGTFTSMDPVGLSRWEGWGKGLGKGAVLLFTQRRLAHTEGCCRAWRVVRSTASLAVGIHMYWFFKTLFLKILRCNIHNIKTHRFKVYCVLVHLTRCITITNSRMFPSLYKYGLYPWPYALILPKVSIQISLSSRQAFKKVGWVNLQSTPIVRKQESYVAQKDTEPKLLAFLAIRLMYFFIWAENSRETDIRQHLPITR